MEAISIQKNIRISPRKIRVVSDLIVNMSPVEAVETLPLIRKRAALVLLKVIKSAVANARQKGMNIDELKFKEIQVNEGPTLKRWRPVSRGSAHSIFKRMSHIRVVVGIAETKKLDIKKEDTKDKKVAKKEVKK